MIIRIWEAISLFFRLQMVVVQQMYGAWKVSRAPRPIVTIFGGSRFDQSDVYAKKAYELACKFVDAGISVLTGGGSGIMEAASCGAMHSEQGRAMSIGINVMDLNEEKNPCMDEYVELRYFYARKWLMTRYAQGFIVFPGGFGTLDELAEVTTLIQTGKSKHVPIVLVGSEFWNPFMHWLRIEVLKHKLVTEKDLQLLHITDDLEQAFCMVRDECAVREQKK